MSKFDCFITGDDYNLLKADTPESRKKVSALASVIFIPVMIWIANGFLLVKYVMEGSFQSAILVGLIMGFLIFLIEKNIIMAHNSRAIRNFRYSLGIIIALLGAVCFDEAVFKPDVDQKLFEMNKAIIDKNLMSVDKAYAAELLLNQKDVGTKYTAWQQALTGAMHEADGSGGSGIKGVHSITKIKLETANALKTDYDNASLSLSQLNIKIKEEKTGTEKRVKDSFNDGALLNRIKALFHLVFSDWFMAIIYLLFTALLFFMEFLVVFLKGAWPKTNYERKLEMIEEIGRKRMEKVLNNDLNYYDNAKVYSAYKDVKKAITNSGSNSIFN